MRFIEPLGVRFARQASKAQDRFGIFKSTEALRKMGAAVATPSELFGHSTKKGHAAWAPARWLLFASVLVRRYGSRAQST